MSHVITLDRLFSLNYVRKLYIDNNITVLCTLICDISPILRKNSRCDAPLSRTNQIFINKYMLMNTYSSSIYHDTEGYVVP